MGKAITIGDHAHARLPAFQRRVALALDTIAEAAKLGRIGVSFSGGKDSTVLLDLVRQVQPESAVAFFDSGCEYPWTYELVEHYGVDVIKPERSLPEMCRYGGYWGYRGPELVDLEAEFDFFAFLIGEPAYRFIHQWGLTTVAIGLRRQESAGRRISLFRHGTLHHMKGGWWHLCPLAGWRHEDIWCLPYGARVLTSAGAYPIGMLVDESIWRFVQVAGSCGWGRILSVSRSRDTQFVCVDVSGQTLVSNIAHMVYTANRGWVAASQLSTNDQLVLLNHQEATRSRNHPTVLRTPIGAPLPEPLHRTGCQRLQPLEGYEWLCARPTKISRFVRSQTVYDLQTESGDFVADGVLVHNSYIASRHLRYNTVYDKMAEFGIDREQWRVSTLLGVSGSNCNARLAFIRAVAPDVFWRLAAEFPYIRGFT